MTDTTMNTLFVTCPKGMEYLLRDELVALGATDVHEARAGVRCAADRTMAMRICLWSRLASRVLWPLAEFEAADDDALYAGVRTIDWREHLEETGTFLVDVTLAAGDRGNSHYLALRVKDAVADQFRERGGEVPRVDKWQPGLRLHVHRRRSHASVALDLAGTPLHQRGWREDQGLAPLKENLAAAMLLRAGWPAIYAAGGTLVDPMCGSGTLLIEAAWMAADVAPGLRRERFGFEGWKRHDAEAWDMLHDEAEGRADEGLRNLRPVFFGSDIDKHMIQVAKYNAQRAEVAGFVHLAKLDFRHAKAPEETATGLVITNPPYGERLGEKADMPVLYRTLGDTLRKHFTGWQAAVLVGDREFGKAMHLHSHKQYQLFNGRLETPLLLFDLGAEKQAPRAPAPLSEGAQMLANRLNKNAKRMRKQLAREDIHAWRVYDRDLPEYAAAIDVYDAVDGQRYLHVQEYRAPRDIPDNVVRTRLHDILRAAGTAFDVPRERVALKQRRRDKGGRQYGMMDERRERITVAEGGLRFLVNLFDYLDTGLFPDHRLVRAKIRELAVGRDMLNLFAYTGTASVYAAAGGAASTMSVDLSATYLDWASANLALNGFAGAANLLAQADAMMFLEQTRQRYGLIFVDPPTFSNSKRAEDFDVQRDHVRLLNACGDRLTDDGVIVFSNNFKRFKLDVEALSDRFDITDWSQSSIPFDYARHATIHGCWILRLKQVG